MLNKAKYYTIVFLILGSLRANSEELTINDASIFTRAESFSWSGANPVTAYFNLLVGPPPEGGNHAFTRNSIEFGMAYDKFEISFIHRNDQNLDFSDGAREFAYLNKNNGQIPLDQYYQVDVWGNQYQASGLKFGYTWDLTDKVQFYAAYSYLMGTEIVSGYLGKDPNGEGGEVAYTMREVGGQNRRVLAGDLYTDLYYTDDPFFRRDVEEPTAQGFAFDVGFSWQIKPDLRLRGKVDDLSAEIHWKDVPHTTATATGDMFEINEDGYAEAVSSFEGVEDWGDYVQKLTRRHRLFLDYSRGRHQWGYNFDHYDVKDFHRLSYGYLWQNGWGGRMSLEATTAALGIDLIMPYGTLGFSIDESDFDSARTIGILWNLNFKL